MAQRYKKDIEPFLNKKEVQQSPVKELPTKPVKEPLLSESVTSPRMTRPVNLKALSMPLYDSSFIRRNSIYQNNNTSESPITNMLRSPTFRHSGKSLA
jgi:hypothetical protein